MCFFLVVIFFFTMILVINKFIFIFLNKFAAVFCENHSVDDGLNFVVSVSSQKTFIKYKKNVLFVIIFAIQKMVIFKKREREGRDFYQIKSMYVCVTKFAGKRMCEKKTITRSPEWLQKNHLFSLQSKRKTYTRTPARTHNQIGAGESVITYIYIQLYVMNTCHMAHSLILFFSPSSSPSPSQSSSS